MNRLKSKDESIDTTEINFQTQSKLSHPVVGRKDVDIAALIDKLQASDWVRRYQNYYNVNDRICRSASKNF